MSSDTAAEWAGMMPGSSAKATAAVASGGGVGINVKRLVKLRARVMLAVFLLVGLPLAAAAWFLSPQQFVATADLEFRSSVPGIFDGGRPLYGGAFEAYVNTQIDIIKSYPLLNRALNQPEVQALPEVRNRRDALRYLFRNLSVDHQRRSEIVTITYRDESRPAALTILNAVLKSYKQYIADEEEQLGGMQRQVLEDREARLEASLDAQRVRIADLRRKYEAPIGAGLEPTETESYRRNLAQAESDITAAQAALRQSQRLLSRVNEFLAQHERDPRAPIYALGVEERVSRDPGVLLLAEQLAAARQEIAVLEETYVDDAPQVRVRRTELSALDRRLAEARGQARGEALRSLYAEYEYEVNAHEADLADAQERRDRFLALLEEYRQENLDMSQGLAEIAELERQYEDTRDYLRQVSNLLLTREIESQAPARVNIHGEATSPQSPDYTLRLRTLLLALAGSMMLALGLGVALEATDQSIRSPEDVAYITGLPILGAVPHTSEDRVPATVNPGTITADFPSAMISDEFRRAVARLLAAEHGGGAPIKSCLIASANRGDGKSTLACNLAIVLAQADRRVLLVDIDSRNPTVERTFGLNPGPGMAEMLSGESLDHDPDRATSYDNLYVLGPGLREHDLMERIASRDMADFLQGAGEIFDHVVIDCPASLLMSETRLLAPMVDGVLVVVGVGVSTFGMLRRCLRTLDDIGCRVLGVVVNGMRQAPGGYLRGNLESYYAGQLGHANRAGGQGTPRPSGNPPSIILTKRKPDAAKRG